ncbi:hypothetical protein GGR55DRAFT_676133 [Xylaria sp. FL0064]|nr:hypothetical protein GGR55DRAFT_676133 [Xylaria sp. FL0064]
MHIPSRTMLPVTLLSLLLSSSSMASAVSERPICVRQNAPILAEAAACGDRHAIQECLLAVTDLVTLDDLQSCFVEGDCTIVEATSEATIILQSCDASVSASELRRRGPDAIPDTPTKKANPGIETSPTPTPTPAPEDSNKDSGSITTSGIVVSVVFGLVVVMVVATVLFYYIRERKARAVAREQEEEEKRKRDQVESEARLRKLAQIQVARERERRQQKETLDWAQRRAGMESQRSLENPFDDRSAV